MLSLEQRIHLKPQGQLDRLAGRTSGRNDDDAPFRVGSVSVRVRVWGEMMVAGGVHL
jgi:hypothetical protein